MPLPGRRGQEHSVSGTAMPVGVVGRGYQGGRVLSLETDFHVSDETFHCSFVAQTETGGDGSRTTQESPEGGHTQGFPS